MKKIITTLLLLLALIAVQSCAKKGCTNNSAPNYNSSATSDDGSCIDLTANLVGSYSGQQYDSTATFDTVSTQTVSVTKVDDQTVKVTVTSIANSVSFQAKLTLSNGIYSLSVASQTSGGITVLGNTNCTGCSSAVCGQYNASARSLSYSVVVTNGTSLDVESFAGTH